MAYYDPYTSYGYDQQDFGYAYDEYGYGYGETPQEERPLPPPDKNWVDPVKVNREYMNKIRKDCVQEEFQGLKEKGFYLLEVLVEAAHLKKDSTEEVKKVEGDSKLNIEEPLTTNVKFLNFKFMEVNGSEIAEKAQRTERVPSYTDLFQTVFTVTGRHKSLVPEEESGGIKVVESTENQDSVEKRKDKDINEKQSDKDIHSTTENLDTVQVMKGKAALIATTGLEMIQNLQQHKVGVRLDRAGQTIGTVSCRLPQTFRRTVLNASTSDVVLPYLTVYSALYTLDQDAGKVALTIVLTCFGQAIVNSVREVPHTNNFKFNNTTLWNRFKFLGSSTTSGPSPVVHPKLALEVLKMGIPFDKRTSSQILQQCISSNLVEFETPPKCDWFGMAEGSIPNYNSTSRLDYEHTKEEHTMDLAALWRKQKQICRDLKNQEKEDKQPSLYERLEEMRMPSMDITDVDVEYCLIDTNNPFEEEAQKHIDDTDTFHVSATSNVPRRSSLKASKK